MCGIAGFMGSGDGALLGEIEELKGDVNDYAFTLSIQQKPSVAQIIDQLTRLMGPANWITELQIDNVRRETSILRLVGFSESNAKLGVFLQALASDELFQNVDLRFARDNADERSGGDGEGPEALIAFELQCEAPRM